MQRRDQLQRGRSRSTIFEQSCDRASGKRQCRTQRKKVNLLDHKRANHIGIALGQLKMDFVDLRKAIISLEDSKISLEQLICLKGVAPTPEEASLVKDFSGDRSKLDRPEAFIAELETIPRLQSRVDNWLFMRNFETKMQEISPQIDSLEKAFVQCTSSKKFQRILSVVLAVGNHLNGGTPNGRAYGFKLDILLKIADTKSSDNTSTLLHWIIDLLDQRFPETMTWWEDMSQVTPASSIASQTIREESGHIKMGLKKIADELENFANNSEEAAQSCNRAYVTRLNGFVDRARVRSESLQARVEGIFKKFKDIATKFGEDPEMYKWEEFFQVLINFNNNIEKCRADTEKKKTRRVEEESQVASSSPPPPSRGQV